MLKFFSNRNREIVERLHTTTGDYVQWLSEFPEVVHVLLTLVATVGGKESLNAGTPAGMEFCDVQGLREQLRRMYKTKNSWRDLSVMLNSFAWRAGTLLGHVKDGDERISVDFATLFSELFELAERGKSANTTRLSSDVPADVRTRALAQIKACTHWNDDETVTILRSTLQRWHAALSAPMDMPAVRVCGGCDWTERADTSEVMLPPLPRGQFIDKETGYVGFTAEQVHEIRQAAISADRKRTQS